MINKIALMIVSLIFCGTFIQAQKTISSVSLGNLYVPADGRIGIFNDHNFAEIGNGLLPGILATDRSFNHGMIVFSGNAEWSNADEYSHIDGFVGAKLKSPFLLPTGDNGIYAPIGVSNADGVQAAFYAVSPDIAITSKVLSVEFTELPELGPFNVEMVNSNVDEVSDQGYWVLNGENESKITLVWNEDAKIERLIKGELDKLTIVAWNGSEWVDIPSSIDKEMINPHSSKMTGSEFNSSFFRGSITTDINVIPDDFSIFTLGKLRYDNTDERNRIMVYPNPVFSGSYLNVNYTLAKSNTGVIKLYNNNNQVLFTKILNSQEDKLEIPLDRYGRGIFTVSITNEKGKTTYQKLIVVDR